MKQVQEININPVKWSARGLEREYNRQDRDVLNDALFLCIDPDETILDLGIGGGIEIKLLREKGAQNIIDVVDYDKDALEFVKQKNLCIRNFYQADLRKPLDFLDKSYDAVIAFETIEHIDRPLIFLSEMARVARKKVIISCPFENCFKGREHFWEFSSGDFEKLLPYYCKSFRTGYKDSFIFTIYYL